MGIKTKLLIVGLCAALLSACAEKYGKSPPDPNFPTSSAPNTSSEGGLQEVVVTGSRKTKRGRKHRRSAQRVAINSSSRPQLLYSEPIQQDRSAYPEFKQNPITLTKDEPVSTFSIDVDTTSYSVMRAHLTQGSLPRHHAIRTEELLNYFTYDYAKPKDAEQPFLPSIDVFDAPWSEQKKLIRIGIQGYDIARDEAPDSNLVFLLDVSGSMGGTNKLPLVKKSIKLLLKSLKPTDRVSMVVYAGAAGVVLEPTQVKNKSVILSAFNRLSAGGSTAGGAGLKLAYELAKQNFDKDAVNRIFIATDGDFNVGTQTPGQLKQMVERNRDAGIYLSVLGFGSYNYQDAVMQAIAQSGNGTAAYIDTLQEAKKVLVDEATSSLFPIANDVKIQVEFNPANVSEYRLLGYETRALAREDFNNDKVDAGEIGAGHSVTALYEITPTGAKPSVDGLRYEKNHKKDTQLPATDTEFDNELAFLKIRYKLPGEATSKLISQAIVEGDQASSDALFAAAVASFAELLRDAKYLGGYKVEDAIKLAKENRGSDASGYRAEFIRLMEMAKLLKPDAVSKN